MNYYSIDQPSLFKENIQIGSEEEINEDGSILDAFESLPPFVSKLKKKKANSQVEKSASKTLRKNPNKEYNTGGKFINTIYLYLLEIICFTSCQMCQLDMKLVSFKKYNYFWRFTERGSLGV